VIPFKIFASAFIPPLGVYLEKGMGKAFWLNMLLTLFGIVPGVVHAVWCLNDQKQGIGLDRLIQKN